MYKLRNGNRSKTLKDQPIKIKQKPNDLSVKPIRSPNLNPTKTFSLNNFSVNQKSFLEILLGLIKISQTDIISSSQKDLKKIITVLKDNLLSISTEQSMKEKYYLEEINKKKLHLQKKIFENEKNEEITKFKSLNFEIENNISTVDYMIEAKKKALEKIKLIDFMPEENKEIFLDQKTNLQKNIVKLMHNSLIKKTEKLCKLIMEKRESDKEIKYIENKLKNNKNLKNNQNVNFHKIPQISEKYFVNDAIEEEKYENGYTTTTIHEDLAKDEECLDEKCISFSDTEEFENIKKNLNSHNSNKRNKTFDSLTMNSYLGLDLPSNINDNNGKISSMTNNSIYKSVSTDI